MTPASTPEHVAAMTPERLAEIRRRTVAGRPEGPGTASGTSLSRLYEAEDHRADLLAEVDRLTEERDALAAELETVLPPVQRSMAERDMALDALTEARTMRDQHRRERDAARAELAGLRQRVEAALDEDVPSMLAEGFHTAFRKAADHPLAMQIHGLIGSLPDREWGAVISFVAEPLADVLRAAVHDGPPSASPDAVTEGVAGDV